MPIDEIIKANDVGIFNVNDLVFLIDEMMCEWSGFKFPIESIQQLTLRNISDLCIYDRYVNLWLRSSTRYMHDKLCHHIFGKMLVYGMF